MTTRTWEQLTRDSDDSKLQPINRRWIFCTGCCSVWSKRRSVLASFGKTSFYVVFTTRRGFLRPRDLESGVCRYVVGGGIGSGPDSVSGDFKFRSELMIIGRNDKFLQQWLPRLSSDCCQLINLFFPKNFFVTPFLCFGLSCRCFSKLESNKLYWWVLFFIFCLSFEFFFESSPMKSLWQICSNCTSNQNSTQHSKPFLWSHDNYLNTSKPVKAMLKVTAVVISASNFAWLWFEKALVIFILFYTSNVWITCSYSNT